MVARRVIPPQAKKASVHEALHYQQVVDRPALFGRNAAPSPQSRAQSDIAPDHFDGTDSWAAAAAAKAPVSKTKSHSAPVILQASSNRSAAPKLEPVAAHEGTAPRRSNAIANKKRKPTTNSNN